MVVIPVAPDEVALDALLGALETATPAGARVWLADDAQGGPRVRAVIDAWRARTRMQAEYSRRPYPLGASAHLAAVLDACGDEDVAVLAADAQPAPGWLDRMAACLDAAPDIASVTPWCNVGETAGWPRMADTAPVPHDLASLAARLASLGMAPQPLPAPVEHAVLLRGTFRRASGGLDATTFQSAYAGLIDLGLRIAAFGGRHVLCTQAYVARSGEGRPADGDLDRLAARWPQWNPALARFLMEDPLADVRARIAMRMADDGSPVAQPDLFGSLRA